MRVELVEEAGLDRVESLAPTRLRLDVVHDADTHLATGSAVGGLHDRAHATGCD